MTAQYLGDVPTVREAIKRHEEILAELDSYDHLPAEMLTDHVLDNLVAITRELVESRKRLRDMGVVNML